MKSKEQYKQIVVVIPSLEPNLILITYLKELLEQGISNIIVINDGSSNEYDPIFHEIEKMKECKLLTHTENLGKGAALKTAFGYIINDMPHVRGIITADSDGQHSVKDVCRLGRELASTKETLLLGCRDFTTPDIPLKSRVGNRLSTLLFWALHGVWLTDTQTGLRAFDSSLLEEMLEIKGERFEYEMEMLIHCSEKKIPLTKLKIQTIYEGNNEGTHFQPVQDSIRIGKTLLSKIGRYIASSGLSTAIDLSIAFILMDVLGQVFPDHDYIRITLAIVIARTCSMIVNYGLNKGFVFGVKQKNKKAAVQYFILAVGNMILSSFGVYCGHRFIGLSDKVAKVIVDTILFIMNFQIQRIWIFRKVKTRKGEYNE